MVSEFCTEYFGRLRHLLDTLDMAALERVVELFLEAYHAERQIFVFGNGGSASAASHFACDINKGVSMYVDKKFKMICLNDNIPTMLAYANDVSYEEVFVGQLRNFLRPGDLVMGISGSGNSKNVLKAIDYANEHGATTFGLTGFDGGKLAQKAHVSLVARVHDMQNVEDMQTILTHVLMRVLVFKLTGKQQAVC